MGWRSAHFHTRSKVEETMRKTILLATVIAGCVSLGTAHAQAPITVQPVDVVAVRQAGMGVMYGTWRSLRIAVDAKLEPKNYVRGAKAIAAFARLIPSLTPPAAGKGTHGLDAMLEDRAGFEQAAANLATAAEALAKVAQANDAVAFPAAVKAVSDGCGGCHPRKYAGDWTK
jgi:cytochrome c556